MTSSRLSSANGVLRVVLLVLVTVVAAPFVRADEPAPQATAPAGLTARAFTIRNKDVEKAAALIKPLLSQDGSYSVQPSKNALVVTDHQANLDKIAAILTKYDVPPRQFSLQLTLVAASRSNSPAQVPPELQEIARKLAGVLRYNSFEKIGGITTTGWEGDSVVVDIKPGYRASFRFGEYDPLTDTVRLEDFRLDKVDGSGSSQSVSVMRTALNIRIGQTIVVGASREPSSNRALMLVLAAEQKK